MAVERGWNVEIEVNRQHIDRGSIAGTSCPIALALKDAGAIAPYVDLDGIQFVYEGVAYYLQPDQGTKDFIRAFDGGDPVEPFAFDIDLRRFIAG